MIGVCGEPKGVSCRQFERSVGSYVRVGLIEVSVWTVTIRVVKRWVYVMMSAVVEDSLCCGGFACQGANRLSW